MTHSIQNAFADETPSMQRHEALRDMPETRWRWVIVTAAALLLGLAMGTLVNGLSAFLIPLERHFGWTRADVSAINSFGLIGIGLGGIGMGFLADRIATRTVCLIGSCVLSVSLLLAGQAQALWQFYALFFVAGAIGGGALFAPVIGLVGRWFSTGAGLAIGIASAGQGLGQGMIPYISGHLIEWLGWQSAFTTLGMAIGLTLLPLSLLMVEPSGKPGKVAAKSSSKPPLPQWIVLPALSVAVLACCTGMAVPLMHLVPLIDCICGSGTEAGGPLLAMLIAAIGGRVFFGKLSDMIGPLPTWMAATAWQTVMVVGFVYLGDIQSFWLFAPLYGFGYGGVMTGVLVSVRALAHPAHVAVSTGFVLAFGWLGHALGGWQGGLLFDLTSNYFWAFANAALAGVLNIAIIAALWLSARNAVAALHSSKPEPAKG